MCNDGENTGQTDIFERATRALHETRVPDDPSSSVLANVLAVVIEALEKPRTRMNSRRTIKVKGSVRAMRPITRIAVAVLIVVGIVGVLSWTTSGNGGRTAFADVVQPFLTARTATFTLAIRIPDTPPQSVEGMLMEPGHARWTMPGGEVIITNAELGKMMTLVPLQKQATVMGFGPPGTVSPQGRLNVLLGIRRHIQDAQEFGDDSVEFLGEQEKDGIAAIGFRAAGPGTAITVWADAETKLPISIEQSINMIHRKMAVAITNIAYDVELDQSLFSLEPPEEYSVTTLSADDIEAGLVVRGVVTDAATGEPIAGAKVSDDGYGPKPHKGATADSAGRYRYVTWGEEHFIVAVAPGYRSQRKGMTMSFLQMEKETVVDFVLERE